MSKKTTHLPYSDEQKSEVVKFVNAYNADHGRGGQPEAASKFGVSQLTIASWLKKHHASQLSTSDSQPLEVVTAAEASAADLAGIASAIEKSIDLVRSHEGAFEEATLEHRLEIGLHVARAQAIFTLSNEDRASLGGDAKAALSTVDKAETPPVESAGFVSWLAKNVKSLKRPTAYRYAAGYKALGIPDGEASPAQIKSKLKDLRHVAGKANLPMPTLASLVKQAPKPPKPEALTVLVPKTSKQKKLEDAREAFHLWKESFDTALKQGLLDALDKKGLEDLKEFTATVRDRINARLK